MVGNNIPQLSDWPVLGPSDALLPARSWAFASLGLDVLRE